MIGLAVALAAALSLGAACARGDPATQPAAIELRAADYDPATSAPVSATWRAGGEERRVTLRPEARRRAGARAFAVTDGDGTAHGTLLLAPPAAALHYHAAASLPAFADRLLPSRLVVFRGGDEPPSVALLLAPRADGGAPFDFDAEDGPGLLAAAEALAAWDVLRAGSALRGPDGGALLPFFVPRDPGTWSDLHGTSLAGFLPEPLARRLAADTAFRRASYTELSRLLEDLPALEETLRDTGAAAGVPDAAAEAAARVARHAAGLGAYLDSTWIGHVATLVTPDVARIEIGVYTVSPVRLEALSLPLTRTLATLGREAIAGLRLRDVASGTVRTVEAHEGRLRFPLARRVRARPWGPYRFRATRLAYELSGLADSPALREHVLEELAPEVTRLDSGEPVAPGHVRRLAAVADPRFSPADGEDRAAFAAALARRLPREDGGPAPALGPDDRALVLHAGRYALRDDLILPLGLDLVLRPGVELRIDPGRSILVRGRLVVDGTARRPVRIRGAVDGAPWGVLAVQGAGARPPAADGASLGSSVRYLELEGGSEDALRGATYSGQLAVHHQDLRLTRTTLRGAHGDDALNVKFGRVLIEDSHFADNAADAVDLDRSDGLVRRCTFGRSGENGDGLDLSGSRVRIEDSVFDAAGDKCVSVGERSQVVLRGSLLRGCAIGVASKDLSLASVSESVFLENERDLAAYRKKAIFGGGRLLGRDLVLIGASEPPLRDAESRIDLEGSVWVGSGSPLPGEGIALAADAPAARALDRRALSRADHFSRAAFRALRDTLSP